MKKQMRPTRRQKMEIKAAGWDPNNWLIERDTNAEMVIVHRHTGTMKKIHKAAAV